MVARSSTSARPSAQAVQAAWAVSRVTQAKKPSLPRFTPITGTPVTSAVRAAWMKVPSPPKVTTSFLPSTRAGSSGTHSPSKRPGWPGGASRWKISTSWPCSASRRLARSTAGSSGLTREWTTKRTSAICPHVNEVLLVALGARDPGGGRGQPRHAGGSCPLAEGSHGVVAVGLVPDHTALADPAPTDFELRLEHHQQLALGSQKPADRGHHLAQRDEAQVAHRQVGNGSGQRIQVADVGALQHHHALILAQPPGELPVSDVDSVDEAGAPLQQGVGEPTCRGAGVEAHPAADIDTEVVQGAVKLLPSPADEAGLR